MVSAINKADDGKPAYLLFGYVDVKLDGCTMTVNEEDKWPLTSLQMIFSNELNRVIEMDEVNRNFNHEGRIKNGAMIKVNRWDYKSNVKMLVTGICEYNMQMKFCLISKFVL